MNLVVGRFARAEIQEAAQFYTAKANAQLGLAFLAEVERATSLMLADPTVGPILRGSRRRYLLRRFPYGVIYQVTAEELRVIALAHHSRRPGYWAKRT